MVRAPKIQGQFDDIAKRENDRKEAKTVQFGNQEKYSSALKTIQEDIIHVEGYDVKDQKL